MKTEIHNFFFFIQQHKPLKKLKTEGYQKKDYEITP